MKIKIGSIVKTNDNKIGIVIFRKNNDNIGINFEHYHLIQNLFDDDSGVNPLKLLRHLTVDRVISKEQIIEKIK